MRFVIIAEDALGYRLARDLCDRVIAERSKWLCDHWKEETSRSNFRTWCALEDGTYRPWSSRSDIKRLAEARSIRIQNGPKAEGALARKACAVAALQSTPPDALFLMHDTDGEKGVEDLMRAGIHSGDDAPPPFEVLVATPHPEAEAWVVAGVVDLAPEEQARHAAERQRLGFDPVTEPDRLSSAKRTDKRDAKQTCETILGTGDRSSERWERCWLQTPLALLESNGKKAWLRSYTAQVEQQILPLLGDELRR